MSIESEEIKLNRYIEIIDYFESGVKDPKELEIWRDVQLIRLMEELKQDITIQNFVRNSIILLNALFEDHPLDTYNNQGRKTDKLSLADKDMYRLTLKRELIAF